MLDDFWKKKLAKTVAKRDVQEKGACGVYIVKHMLLRWKSKFEASRMSQNGKQIGTNSLCENRSRFLTYFGEFWNQNGSILVPKPVQKSIKNQACQEEDQTRAKGGVKGWPWGVVGGLGARKNT